VAGRSASHAGDFRQRRIQRRAVRYHCRRAEDGKLPRLDRTADRTGRHDRVPSGARR
jgi:hypothetical protein